MVPMGEYKVIDKKLYKCQIEHLKDYRGIGDAS